MQALLTSIMATRDKCNRTPLGTVAKAQQDSPAEDLSVKGLPTYGMESVPARFIRTESELASFCPHNSMALEPIPMIDMEGLHDYRCQFTMAAISSACRHWGCFQVVNHDIPQPVLDAALKAARDFFEMPLEEKQSYEKETEESNGSDNGIQSLESKDTVVDWGDVMFHEDLKNWPANPPDYKNAMLSYARESRKVMEKLLDVVSKELRLVPTYFRDLFGDFEQSLRVNHYPPCPQPELVLGLRPHTDPVVFTALLEDQTRGLQVRNGDKWVTVDPEPDALVIFVGEQLQIASNGRYKAVTHRAVVNKTTDRISIAMGLAPNSKVLVRPAPELLEKSSPPRYEAHTYGEFRATVSHGVRW